MEPVGGADVDDVDVRVGQQRLLSCGAQPIGRNLGRCPLGRCCRNAVNGGREGQAAVKIRQVCHGVSMCFSHRAEAEHTDMERLRVHGAVSFA